MASKGILWARLVFRWRLGGKEFVDLGVWQGLLRRPRKGLAFCSRRFGIVVVCRRRKERGEVVSRAKP